MSYRLVDEDTSVSEQGNYLIAILDKCDESNLGIKSSLHSLMHLNSTMYRNFSVIFAWHFFTSSFEDRPLAAWICES